MENGPTLNLLNFETVVKLQFTGMKLSLKGDPLPSLIAINSIPLGFLEFLVLILLNHYAFYASP